MLSTKESSLKVQPLYVKDNQNFGLNLSISDRYQSLELPVQWIFLVRTIYTLQRIIFIHANLIIWRKKTLKVELFLILIG